MHELGLCEAILDAVERRAAGRRVTGVRLQVGTLHRVSKPALIQAFSLVAEGSIAEEARLELSILPVRVGCRSCGAALEAEELLFVCPGCGAGDIEATGGDELVLEALELEATSEVAEEEQPCA